MEQVPSKQFEMEPKRKVDWLGWIGFGCAILVALVLGDGFSLPSSIALGHIYISKVVAGEIYALKQYNAGPEFCWDSLLDQAKQDVRYLANAEIGELTIISERTSGSSDTIEFVYIMLTFRRPGETTWRHGRIALSTNRKFIGVRYFCAELGMYSEYW